MKMDCEVIRDLLPLYADDACSEKSREAVEEHLAECEACSDELRRLRENEIESGLKQEKNEVVSYLVREFKRRSAIVGSAVSGVIMIPILVCVAIGLISGVRIDLTSVILASMCVAASLIVVPIIMKENKAFWMLSAFTASLMLLLAVVCLYTQGNWFWIASSASLFGLATVFLPFAIRAKPLQKWVGNHRRWLIVLCTDALLFLNMMNMITSHGKWTLSTILFTLALIAGFGAVAAEIFRKRGSK